jgi:hypothetical protein
MPKSMRRTSRRVGVEDEEAQSASGPSSSFRRYSSIASRQGSYRGSSCRYPASCFQGAASAATLNSVSFAPAFTRVRTWSASRSTASAGVAPSAIRPTDSPPAPVTRYLLPVTGSIMTETSTGYPPFSSTYRNSFYRGHSGAGRAPPRSRTPCERVGPHFPSRSFAVQRAWMMSKRWGGFDRSTTNTSLPCRVSTDISASALRCLRFLLFKAGLRRAPSALSYRQRP